MMQYGEVVDGGSTTDVTEDRPIGHPTTIIRLNTSLLRKRRPKGLLCIDFGTAASKAAYDLHRDEPQPLAVGARGNDPDGIYWVSSTIAAKPDGTILLGGAAETYLRNNPSASGVRSFKSKLWGDPEILRTTALMANGIAFSFADCVLSFVSCLTRLISLELEGEGQNRHMPRRYAMPYAYDDERVSVRALFGQMIGQAAILADTLGDELVEGISATRLRAALDAVDGMAAPAWLLDTKPPCIGEPVAAGNFAMDEELGPRTVYMVVDVGAGTTDFCILCLKKKADGSFEPIQIRNGSLSVECAGDAVDEALGDYIRDTWGIHDIKRAMGLELRQLKESLFKEQRFERDLADSTPFSIELQDFVASKQWNRFAHTLQAAQKACLNQADQKYLLDYGGGAVRVVLTGGGSGLPLTGTLATRRLRGIKRTFAPALPEDLRDRYFEIENDLPRLTVALGGSFEITPIELDRSEAKTSLGITAPRIWKPLDKTATGLDEDVS